MSKLFQFRIGETADGKPVKLDLATLIDTKLLAVANSGGGKSYTMRVLIERTVERVQWIVIDPEGEYATLREKFDFLLIGADGELPVNERSAALLARKLMETRASAIIDLYGLLELRAPWTAKFLNALMTLPKTLWSPLMVAIDEAHKLAPETPEGTKMEREGLYVSRKAVTTLTDSGRKQNRGAAIATQRLNKLAANARGDLNNNFIGRMVQDLDRERAADILGISKRDSIVLRELEPGEFFAFGPAFLHKGVERIKVDRAETKHPKAGERHLGDVPKASGALQGIIAQLSDLPKEAEEEANTLEALTRKNVELERKLRERPVPVLTRPEPVTQRIEVPVFKDGELGRLETAIRQWSETGTQLVAVGNQIITAGNQVANAAREVRQSLDGVLKVQARPPAISVRPAPGPVRTVVAQRVLLETNMVVGERKILSAIAQYPEGATRDQLTVLTGYKRSSRDTYIQRLAQRGYIQVNGVIVATNAGIEALGSDFQPLPVGAELREYWSRRLTGGEKAIYEVVLQAYPNPVDRDIVSEITQYKRSSRDTYIQRLASRRLVTLQGGGKIRASDELFTA